VEGIKIVVDRARGSMSLAIVARNVCWKAVSLVEVGYRNFVIKDTFDKVIIGDMEDRWP
jgi:hypothetical protein